MIILILLVSAIFYRGAKSRQLLTYVWALIGIGSAVVGTFLGFVTGFIIEYFTSHSLTILASGFAVAIATVVIAYWMMDQYLRKVNIKKRENDDLLDNR